MGFRDSGDKSEILANLMQAQELWDQRLYGDAVVFLQGLEETPEVQQMISDIEEDYFQQLQLLFDKTCEGYSMNLTLHDDMEEITSVYRQNGEYILWDYLFSSESYWWNRFVYVFDSTDESLYQKTTDIFALEKDLVANQEEVEDLYDSLKNTPQQYKQMFRDIEALKLAYQSLNRYIIEDQRSNYSDRVEKVEEKLDVLEENYPELFGE